MSKLLFQYDVNLFETNKDLIIAMIVSRRKIYINRRWSLYFITVFIFFNR